MKYMELNEGKAHGSAGFPLQYYAVDATHPQFRMPPHWHREFEIIRVNAGRFSAHLDNHPYPLSPVTACFAPEEPCTAGNRRMRTATMNAWYLILTSCAAQEAL